MSEAPYWMGSRGTRSSAAPAYVVNAATEMLGRRAIPDGNGGVRVPGVEGSLGNLQDVLAVQAAEAAEQAARAAQVAADAGDLSLRAA